MDEVFAERRHRGRRREDKSSQTVYAKNYWDLRGAEGPIYIVPPDDGEQPEAHPTTTGSVPPSNKQ